MTFSGITGRAELAAVAGRLMAIRPHRDAGSDGVTMITATRTAGPGYAAFTDAELIPHTDGSSAGLDAVIAQQTAARGSPLMRDHDATALTAVELDPDSLPPSTPRGHPLVPRAASGYHGGPEAAELRRRLG